MVQWLELGVVTAEGLVSIPGQGTEITQAVQNGKKKKKKKTTPKPTALGWPLPVQSPQ